MSIIGTSSNTNFRAPQPTTMILAFSPEQAHDVSQAFDGLWWVNEALYPDHIRKENTAKKQDGSEAAPASSTKKTPCEQPKRPCFPNSSNQGCRRRTNCFPSRCQTPHQKKTTSIQHKTPIHYHDETPEAAKMSLDVTGFDPKDIAIQVEDYVVSIKGQRTNKLGDVFVLDRRFRLDKKTTSVEAVTAAFEDGILELTVPKKPTNGPRSIPIGVVSSSSTTTTSSSSESDSNSDEDHDETVASRVDHEIVAESTEGSEDPPSTEGRQENQQGEEAIKADTEVETIDEHEHEHEKESQNESWEEVVENPLYSQIG